MSYRVAWVTVALAVAGCESSRRREAPTRSDIEDVTLVPGDAGVVAIDTVGGYQIEFPKAPKLIQVLDRDPRTGLVRDEALGVQVGDVAYIVEIERLAPLDSATTVSEIYDREVDRMRANGRFVQTSFDTSLAGLPARGLTARGATFGLAIDMTAWIVATPEHHTLYLLNIGGWSGTNSDARGDRFPASFRRVRASTSP